MFYLLTEFCGLASFQRGWARESLIYLTTSSCLWPHSLEKYSTNSDAAERHRDINNNTQAGRQAVLLLLALPRVKGIEHSEGKLLMAHVPTSRATAAPACSGSTGCTEDSSICNEIGEQDHPLLSHYCSGTAANLCLESGVRGKGDPGKALGAVQQ